MKGLSKFFVLLAVCLTGVGFSSCEEDENHQGAEMLRIYMGASTFYGEGAEGEIVMPISFSDPQFKPTTNNLFFGISNSWEPEGSAYRPEWNLKAVEPDGDKQNSWLAIFTYKTGRTVHLEGFMTVKGRQVQAPAVTVVLTP